ncbi:MAG: AAA family ATPase, partial [Anaeroplasmataceae bacterium]
EQVDLVKFKRFDTPEVELTDNELAISLSSGTLRGVELFIKAFKVLKNGGLLLIDEIESCFQKNVVSNLIFLFNDSDINLKNAQLMFSTHYVEILDILNRRDSIYIMKKVEGKVNVKNLYLDFKVRTENLKSKQFDNNVFGTLLNYDQLLKVRKGLLNELRSNID